MKDYGVGLAIKMIQRLTGEGKVPGVHFCTLNLEKSVHRVCEGLGWTAPSSRVPNKLITVCTSLHPTLNDPYTLLRIRPSSHYTRFQQILPESSTLTTQRTQPSTVSHTTACLTKQERVNSTMHQAGTISLTVASVTSKVLHSVNLTRGVHLTSP